MLVELSVTQQRYHAVMEVVSRVAAYRGDRRYGGSPKAVHLWLGKYQREVSAALAGHSHRPRWLGVLVWHGLATTRKRQRRRGPRSNRRQCALLLESGGHPSLLFAHETIAGA